MFSFFRKNKTFHKSDDNPIDHIEHHLKNMGYCLTSYGAGVALVEFMSGYSEVETASHIALTTMALDIKDAGFDMNILIEISIHAQALLKVLKEYKDKGMIHPTQWQNDSAAILGISYVDEKQEDWIEKVLSDPIAGKERLANSRINYS